MTVFHSSLYDLRFPFLFLPLRLEMSSILVSSVSVSDIIIVWLDVVMRVKINNLEIVTIGWLSLAHKHKHA